MITVPIGFFPDIQKQSMIEYLYTENEHILLLDLMNIPLLFNYHKIKNGFKNQNINSNLIIS